MLNVKVHDSTIRKRLGGQHSLIKLSKVASKQTTNTSDKLSSTVEEG